MTIHITPLHRPELDDSFALWRTQYPQYSSLIDAGAPPLTTLRYLGLVLWRDGRLDDAASVLTKAASLAPDEPVILGELGSLLRAGGRKTEAMHYLTASLKLDPKQTLVWLNVAGLFNEAGDKTSAEQAFRAALELDSTSAEAAAGLGLLYIEMRRFEEAARQLNAAVERGVTAMAIYACLGQTLYLLGDFSKASAALEKAARACPDEARIVQKYALARLTETMLESSAEEAIAVYHAIAGRHSEEVSGVCRTAFQALCGYGRKEAAIRLAEALLERVPDDPIISYHLDALRGQAYECAPCNYVKASFDKYAPDFDRHLVDVLDYRIPDKLHPFLVATGMTFSRILDLGCGTGLAAPYLAPFGGNLTGVDLSPCMLDKARERNLYDRLIENEAIHYLSKREEQFDLIVSLDVLVYIGDLTTLFTAVAGRMVSGGVFAFSFETGQNADYRLMPSGRFAHDPAYIERLYGENFNCISCVPTMLRLEANQPVAGCIVLLRRL